jgi:hypothetical protein
VQGVVGPQGPQGDAGAQGAAGQTAFEVWQSLPGNETRTIEEYTATLVGPQGVQGEAGPQGPQGVVGPQGPQGDTGPQGAAGQTAFEVWQSLPGNETRTIEEYNATLVGPQGVPGETGPQGLQGVVGPQGPQGDAGAQGAAGQTAFEVWQSLPGNETRTIEDYNATLVGPQGVQGEAGPQGAQGVVGPQGPQGDVGPQGAAGQTAFEVWQSLPGNETRTIEDYNATLVGPQGPQGEQGPASLVAGPQGPQGSQGEAGDAGPQGPQGTKGETGDTGPAGPAGPQGPQGPQGRPGSGIVGYVSLDADKNISSSFSTTALVQNSGAVTGVASFTSGVYCFRVAIAYRTVNVTQDAGKDNKASYVSATPGTTDGCPSGTNLVVRIFDYGPSPSFASRSFHMMFM